jgi:ubiquitin carboxyl-terminal hydrolase 36/42
MERLQAEVFQSNGRPFTPSSIVKNIRVIGPRFRPGRQEDSHEFIRLALEAMHKNALANSTPTKDERVKETSVIHRIFGGYFRSQVRCESCGFCSNTYDAFLDLSLDVYKLASVDRALQAFTKTDYLEGDNAYKCSKCSQRVRAAKRLSVHRAPPVLTIHLKRFQFVQMFGGAKINKPIAFPETLDMSPYMSFPKAARRDGTHIYKLYAVLVHSGSSTDCGHYYSFVRAPNDAWFRCDDSSVHSIDICSNFRSNS